MNKAILPKSDDWEGLYVNGRLIQEGHELNQGEERAIYFAKLAKEYNFDLLEMKTGYLCQEDIRDTEEAGCYPLNIYEFIGNYREEE